MQNPNESAPREGTKLITCVLPDDGSHKVLLKALRDEKQIIRAEATSCLGVGGLADATVKPGMLPDTFMERLVTVVVPEAEADALFEYIYEKARVGRDGGGIVIQSALATATPYTLPEDLPDERT